MSDPQGGLVDALVAAQLELPTALGKDSDGQIQNRTYKYLSLDKLIEATRSVLTKHGLAIVQHPAMVGRGDDGAMVPAHGGEWTADCCGVCGKPPSTTRHMDRDHDHVTGKPRGLACPGNTGCNALMPRQLTLERARLIVAYLERVAARDESEVAA